MFASTVTIGRISAGNSTFLIRFPLEMSTPDASVSDDENTSTEDAAEHEEREGSTAAGRVPGSTAVNTNV